MFRNTESFRESELLNSLGCLKRFFCMANASDMDKQIAKMLRKNSAVKRRLELQITKLRQSEFYKDLAKKSELENVLGNLDAWETELQLVQAQMHAEYFGLSATFFDDRLWPATVKLSTRYQFATGIFGDWLYDTHSLYILMAEFADARKASRRSANTDSAKLRARMDSLRISEMGEVKLCRDCGRPMIPCYDCGALIKPCFLEMGMMHICESVASDGVPGERVSGDSALN